VGEIESLREPVRLRAAQKTTVPEENGLFAHAGRGWLVLQISHIID
jgi:hypothetical protein